MKDCILCCEAGNPSSSCCCDDCLLKLGGLADGPPLRILGPGESKRAFEIAATACDAVEEMFLKNVPDPPSPPLSLPALYILFLCAAIACSFVGVSSAAPPPPGGCPSWPISYVNSGLNNSSTPYCLQNSNPFSNFIQVPWYFPYPP